MSLTWCVRLQRSSCSKNRQSFTAVYNASHEKKIVRNKARWAGEINVVWHSIVGFNVPLGHIGDKFRLSPIRSTLSPVCIPGFIGHFADDFTGQMS